MPSLASGDAWVLGHVCAHGTDGPELRWELRRNCSIAPSQLLAVYLSLCLLSLAIAAAFALHGATAVLAFAGIELLAVGAAMLVYARHAGDGDTLRLAGRRLQVEQANGRRTARTEFRAEWLSVEPSREDGSLVELAGEGRRIRIGRFLRPHLRARLALELRLALRMALARSPSAHPA